MKPPPDDTAREFYLMLASSMFGLILILYLVIVSR